jgi:hypothetical protein
MWTIALQIGIAVGLWALNKYVIGDAKLPKPRPEGLEFAQATIGSPIPYVAGTVRVDNSVLVWAGNYDFALEQGHSRYGIDMLLVLGVPMWDEAGEPWGSWRTANPPQVTRLWYGDALSSAIPPNPAGKHGVLKSNFIVGAGFDNRITAQFQFFDGRTDQTLVGTYTETRLLNAGVQADLIPGYRNKMLLAIFASPDDETKPPNQATSYWRIGYDNPRVAAIGVEVRALGPDPILGTEANPAWVLYDLLCRPVWGLGYEAANVDLASFEAAAITLVAEDHGCSVVIQQIEDAPRVFHSLLAQVDGIVFENPATGKIELKLIRNDYVIGDLQELTVDNTLGAPERSDTSPRDTINEVNVRFTNRARFYKTDTRTAQRNGNSAARNYRIRTLDFDAPGVTRPELAATIAARELSVHGRSLIIIKCRVNREFYAVKPGDPLKANWPAIGIVDKVFRVLEVDFGQLADGAIRLALVEDVFDRTVGAFPANPEDDTPITLPPLTERVLDEAPWFLQYQAFNDGGIPNLTDQRIMFAAVAEGLANRLRESTKSGGTTGILSGSTLADGGPWPFVTTGLVATAYPATAAPYDTASGLVVEDVAGEYAATFADLEASASDIAAGGAWFVLVGEEIVAFESVADLGGGQYRLENVHREQFDTVPVDHAVGERFYLIDIRSIGRRSWPVGFHARGFAIPSYLGTLGSDGENASDDIVIEGRAALEVRAADVRITGYDLDGTAGIPTTTQTYPLLGDFKAASRMEGSVNISGRERQRDVGSVVRGDDAAAYSAAPGTEWEVYAQKVGEDEHVIKGKTGLSAPAATGVLVGAAGHGEIDIILHTVDDDAARSWQSPRVRVTAPTWRDLAANGSFDHNALLPGWAATAGTGGVTSGTDSLPRTASGRWFDAATATGGDTTIRQAVDVAGYKAGGLTALVTWYSRNFAGAPADTSEVTVRALDVDDVELDVVTSSAVIGPATHWQRAEQEIELPVGTSTVAVEVTTSNAAGSGSTPSDTGVTRVQLQVGQMSAELLTNPSFDGNLTSWTNVVNSFVLNSTNPYSSRNGTIGAAQGGAFANSEIKQEPAIPAGYEYGVALLTLGRSTTLDNDTGEVVLEVLNGGGTVIASATTGAEFALVQGVAVLDVWERRRLAVQLPDGAVTLRVRLLAVRTLGSGNSGACFDDLSLRIHKDLDPVFERDFDFGAPTWQLLPATWQRFHLQFPALPMPIAVWGGSSETPSVQPTYRLSGPEHAWSDAIVHTAAKFVGYWDIGPSALFTADDLERAVSTEAYQFERTAAVDAIDLQTTGADDDGEEYGAFAIDEPFTVAVCLRTDEPRPSGLGIACGLVGRRSVTGVGWGLRIDATGLLEAVIQGAGGTATAAAVTAINDRAPHWAILVHDAGATTLRLYDDHGGSATASTAAVGSLAAADVPFRIGRDGPASQTGGVQISRVFLWNEALTAGDVAEIMMYGRDPSELLTSWTSDRAVWVPGPDDIDGATLVRFASDHVPIGYSSALDADGYGLTLTAASTNKIPSHDFTESAKWSAEAGVTLTQDVVDLTGLPRGVRVANLGADQAIRCEGIVMGAGTPLSVVFYARTIDAVASYDLGVVLTDTDDIVIDIVTVAITPLWQRFRVELGPWMDSTPNGILRFVLGAVGTFDLSPVIWAAFGADAPIAIQDAALAISDTYGDLVETLPLQLTHEGEVYVEGLASVASPPDGATLAGIDNDADDLDERALLIGAAAAPEFTLWDDAGSPTTESATAIDWSAPFVVRGRWNRLELPESLGDQAGIVVDGSADSSAYDPLAFDAGTALEAIRIGGGNPSGSESPNALIRRVRVRAREPKLP